MDFVNKCSASDNKSEMDGTVSEILDLQDSYDTTLTDNLIEYTEEPVITSEGIEETQKDFEDEIEKAIIESKSDTPIIITNAKPGISHINTTSTSNKVFPIKIAAKPNPTQASSMTKLSAIKAGGQIVIIQTPGGTAQPIRISGAPTSSHFGTEQGIKFIKTADGNIIQIRNKASLQNATGSLKRIIQPQKIANPVGKLIYKGITVKGNEQQIMLSTAPTKVPATIVTSTNGSTTTTTKTISITDAQQLGLLASGKIKQIMVSQKSNKPHNIQTLKPLPKLLPAPPTSPNTPSPQALTNAIKKIPAIQAKGAIPLIKSTIPIGKKISTMHSGMIKLSGASGNSVQQINIPGKKMQYVRFITMTPTMATQTGSVSTGKIICTPKVVPSSNATPTTSGQQKILIQGKSGQTVALIQQTPTSIGQAKIITMSQNTSSKINTASSSLTKVLQPIQQKKMIPISKTPLNDSQKIIAVKSETDTISVTPKLTSLTPAQLSQIQGTSLLAIKKPPMLVLPPNFVQQFHQKTTKKVELVVSQNQIKKEIDESNDTENAVISNESKSPDSDNRKKPCNCTRSQCLKLYCDCFANGEFCSGCNCRECFNNLEYETERQKAIRVCLERNPNAFRPKIGKAKDKDQSLRRHNKGCNCKRSGCLKNYCECYEAKISCSANCKCFGCRNNDDFFDRSEFSNVDEYKPSSRKTKHSMDSIDKSDLPPSKQPYNFMTSDVIDATVQCMVAQAEECQRKGYKTQFAEKLILEEFGRCLIEIIDFSIRNTDNE